MIAKKTEKAKAIHLRRQGLSYSEILDHLPVTKSTLSLWLRSVNLSKKQKRRLSEKMAVSALKGAKARRDKRIIATKLIQNEAMQEIGNISKRELLLIGAALHWAEGSKEKEYKPGVGVIFTNSDPIMIRLFLKWLKEVCDIGYENLGFEIYLHQNSRNNAKKVENFWREQTGSPKNEFRIYFKKIKKNVTNRRNIDNKYYGVLRIKVKASTSLNRKISGWIAGICKYCRVV